MSVCKERFTNKQMILFLLPIIFEQLMMGTLGIADTVMVSAKLGATSLAGVALVNRIDNFAKQFFLAFAQGGSVVLAQYIGAKNEENSRLSLKTNIQIVVSLAIIVMAIMLFFKQQCINLFFGNAEKDVLDVSLKYFSITAVSYPFVALYYSCTSQFRVMGESKIPFISSVIMMGLNLIFKYIFIFRFETGVGGAAFSTLLAMAIVGFALFFRLTNKKCLVRLTNALKLEFNPRMASRILKISFPNGIEQGLFQLGALLLAGVVSGLGEDAINADQVARNLNSYIHAISPAFCALMLMVTGQCMGAGEVTEAEMYKKRILKINRIFSIVVCTVFLIIMKPLLMMFNISELSRQWTAQCLLIYIIGTITFYPTSFTTAAALRGTGDTRFVMTVAGLSMFCFRLGVAYIMVEVFKLGVLSIWIAMTLDWIARSVIFELRYKRGKWKNHQVI